MASYFLSVAFCLYIQYWKGSETSPSLTETFAKQGRPDFISEVELNDLTMGLSIMRPLSSLDEVIELDSPE